MKTEIKFGTDGFRGIIAKDFTFETVVRIIDAISIYLKNLNSNNNVIIVGYDPRFMARDFALLSANRLKDNGFDVVLSSCVVPTPIVAYQAKYYPESLGAIMITASHNPKEYQGIKFIPNYAGPATKEITDEILKHLDKPVENSKKGSIKETFLAESYFEALEKLIDFEAIKNNCPNIIYDGLCSASIGYFDEILKRHDIKFKSYNLFHSSDFLGGLPEPKIPFIKHIEKGYITVANDGDADRYGVIDEKGNYISANIILAILLKYFVEKGKKGFMIKTVGVSNFVSIMAKKLNIETITTPVGFKWLSEAMRKNETILAGEDSAGLSTGNHIPEKDGLFANLLIIEAMAKTNKTLYELVKDAINFVGCEFFTDRVDIKLENDETVKKALDIFSKKENIEGLIVKDKLDIDGIKLFLDDKLTSILIRKSGTEPLLRFYIESNNIEKLNIIKNYIVKDFS